MTLPSIRCSVEIDRVKRHLLESNAMDPSIDSLDAKVVALTENGEWVFMKICMLNRRNRPNL